MGNLEKYGQQKTDQSKATSSRSKHPRKRTKLELDHKSFTPSGGQASDSQATSCSNPRPTSNAASFKLRNVGYIHL